MTRPISAELTRFRALTSVRLGLHFGDDKSDFLADLLSARAVRSGQSIGTYLDRLEQNAAGAAAEEIRSLSETLTVAETYFFRNADQFRALVEAVVPAVLAARPGRRSLRVLSAGCASGEEPYTLAIALRQTRELAGADLSILAVDVNPTMIGRAARARYSAWSLRETPPEIQSRWFRADGRDLVLDEEIRAQVTFAERNLAAGDPLLWQPESRDVVFCRNVLMYFTPQAARDLVGRITSTLAPGGFLFLGHAETLRGLSQDFHLHHTHGTFYYQRRPHVALPARGSAVSASPTGLALPAPVVDAGVSWIDVIQRASSRIEALAARPSFPAHRTASTEPRWDLGLAIELLRTERFRDALALLDGFPPESGRDVDVLLLRAALLTHSGALAEAEAVSRALLQLDEMNAGAHYLTALCREHAGDRRGAVERDQVAVYLDPSFAMPHLHLGLLARRGGEAADARRELENALALLEREDASRLLLFGGGFSREALLALCRAELAACGGST